MLGCRAVALPTTEQIVCIYSFTICHVICIALHLRHISAILVPSTVFIILVSISFSTDLMKRCRRHGESLSVFKIFSVDKNLRELSSAYKCN